MYKITKILTGGFVNNTTVVKDKDGNILTNNEERPDPDEEAIVEDTDFHIKIK